MLIVVVWWLWMQVIGLAALPLAHRFFRRLPGRGYAFARPLGLLLACFVLWMGSSLGLLRNSVGGALFSILAVAVASFAFYRRGREGGSPGLFAWLRQNWRLVIAVETLFAGAFALWALIRAYSPDLTTAGGEKFMEIMYLNSIGRSEYFPPLDAWLSGYAISYYYFGYVMIATLTRLSGFAAHMTFNVGVALLFALTCTGAFGLVYNLVKGAEDTEESDHDPQTSSSAASPVAWGFLGAILVAVLGNLEGFFEALYGAKVLPEGFWRWLDIKDINMPFDPSATASWIPARSGWWWWRASRVIHDLDPAGKSMGIQPIDEFPGFSFLLGDMHPHVLALPFVLLALALALNELRRGPDESEGWLGSLKQLSLLVPLCLGSLAFLNTWDFPIYWLVFVAAYGFRRWDRYGRFTWPFLRDVGVNAVAIAILGLLFYLPFYVGFQSQAGGLLPTLYVGTRFRQYFVMFGPFLVAIAGLLTILSLRFRRQPSGRQLLRDALGWTAAFVLAPLGLMLLIALVMLLTPQGRDFLEGIRHLPFVYEIVGEKSWPAVLADLLLVKLRTWVMPLIVALMAALGTALLQRSIPRQPAPQAMGNTEKLLRHPSIRFVLISVVVGLLLTLSVEFFYLDDNFKVRMNTIFKFYFQAWVLMAIASAFAIYWLGRRKGWLRVGFLAGFWLLFAMGMVYPVLGNTARAGNFAHAPNLDGTAYLAMGQAEDHAAAAWLDENVDGAPVILEAPGTGGSSYVYEGRISALTGLPTLLGWAGHEGQWRGSYEIQDARQPDIETIYNTRDPQLAQALIEEYGISYIYVGPTEHATYDPAGLAKFGRFMDVVYQQDSVTIYRSSN
jgi:YYY domain-containing protein